MAPHAVSNGRRQVTDTRTKSAILEAAEQGRFLSKEIAYDMELIANQFALRYILRQWPGFCRSRAMPAFLFESLDASVFLSSLVWILTDAGLTRKDSKKSL